MSTHNKMYEIVKQKQTYAMDVVNFRSAFGQTLDQELLYCHLNLYFDSSFHLSLNI